MTDTSLPTTRPKHARSTSITTSTKKNTSHQRKPSFTLQQQQQHQQQQQQQQQQQHYPNVKQPRPSVTNNNKTTFLDTINAVISKVHAFLNPSGPLLPHSKHSHGFVKPSLFHSILQSRVIRFIALFYLIFSVFLSLNHTWKYFTSSNSIQIPHHETSESSTQQQQQQDWVPQRTYDQDESYSLMDQMTHGLKMHKMFSKSYYEAAKNARPFWKKASNIPDNDEVTVITTVTPETWDDLKRLTAYWEGPISAIVHVQEDDDSFIAKMSTDYDNTPELNTNVDLHLTIVPGKHLLNVLLPRNAERNLARLLSTTEYILDLPAGVIPATDLRRTLEINKERIDHLLQSGDLLAIPTFSFKSSYVTRDDIPYDKTQLIYKLSEEKMILDDKHWQENEGPTDLEKWMDAETLYAVEKYEFHYEPVVIESKTIQPWCSERFLDSRAACIFASYLEGNEIWILPDDFMVQIPNPQLEKEVTDFDNVVENRIYAKFYWEQCVHHARQLDALGLWKSPKSAHVRDQCSRVIQNWGKGLIGTPE